MKRGLIIVAVSIFVLTATLLGAFFLFPSDKDNDQQVTDLKIEQSDKKSTSTTRPMPDEDAEEVTSEEDLETETSGEPVDILSTIKDSTSDYEYDADATRHFKTDEVYDQEHYNEQVKKNSFVVASGGQDLPDKHQEISSIFSEIFEQLKEYHDKSEKSKSAIDPTMFDLEALISADYFGGFIPTELFTLSSHFRLSHDPSTIKVVKGQGEFDFIADTVLVDKDQKQVAHLSTLVKDDHVVEYKLTTLREGAIILDQKSQSSESPQYSSDQ